MKPLPINRLIARRLAILAILAAGVSEIESRLTFVLTESIHATLLWRAEETPEKGDYVNYILDKKYTDGRQLIVTKKIQCVTGEILEVRNRDYYCNGQWLGIAKEKSKKGELLLPFVWNGDVPQGKVFLMGEHSDSWDSRYWGFATLSKAQKVIKII